MLFCFSVKPENAQLTVSDSSICQGDVFNLSCSADGNPAVHTYLLFENDIPLNTSGSSVVHVTRTASAAGVLVYRCEANNTVGTANATTTVAVNGKENKKHKEMCICNVFRYRIYSNKRPTSN